MRAPASCILVVGAAGYIGSHMVKLLRHAGHLPIVLDDLSAGRRGRPSVPGGGDAGDEGVLDEIFHTWPVAAVMHFAGLAQVGESVNDPSLYYQHNVGKTMTLLSAMVRHRVTRFIFSSSVAIFGEPQSALFDEQHPTLPVSPYGRSKLTIGGSTLMRR